MNTNNRTKKTAVLLTLLSVSICSQAVTYDFENIGQNGTSFSSSGQTFTVSPDLIGIYFETYGSELNGNGLTSDGYLDTVYGTSKSGNVGGINAPTGMTFRAQSFDVWPSENQGGVVQDTGALVRVLGYRNNQQIISENVAMIDFGQNTALNVRWHRIDLTGTAFNNTDVDSVQFELIGNQDYIAVDNFIYDNLQSANDLPTIGGTNSSQGVNDDATILPFSNVTLGEPDGDNISLIVTLDDNAKGIFTSASLNASGFSGAGPYSLSSMTAANAQAAIRQLDFNPTDDRVAPGQTETTAFTINASDGVGSINDNSTTVVSTSIDQVPVASFDEFLILEDTANATYDVLDNDNDVDGGPRVVTSVDNPTHGTANNNSTNISYQPDADYCNDGNGTDNYFYHINGGSSAEVYMSVTCVNDAPSFTVMGDVDATGLVDAQMSEIQVPGFAENISMGPENENSQAVLGFFANCTDPDGVVDQIQIDFNGKLIIDFTLNLGVASCQATLLDNGGTLNNGQNTSAAVFFNVSFTDMIFENGFENLADFIASLNKKLTMAGFNKSIEVDDALQTLYFNGQELILNKQDSPSKQNQMIKLWLKSTLYDLQF
ncbi:Ig-like domain-containing protein [Marinicella rhabdoformis]|uniref:Ig-like domain-containing protein n=1 Tax=Marinicella rhabdoformis TaxID=2580566 RepID=UPI0012AECA18|nr:hypothetical protein [Marinicella rhabdoformis]